MSTFDLLSLRLPIVQAPMAGGPSTPALAAAVSDAGGLGSLATGYLTVEAAQVQLETFRSLSDGPVAVNVFVPEAHAPAEADVRAYRDSLAAWAEREGVEGTIPPVPSPGQAEWDTYADLLAMLERRRTSCAACRRLGSSWGSP
jgi:nitronate monooxygenase